MARWRAGLALLALCLAMAQAAPVKKPTARPGRCLNTMLSEIKEADSKPKGYGVIFYGDSIMETLRGTDRCDACDRTQRRSSCSGVAPMFQRLFGRYDPGVMAMSMDESAHLLWRLQNGQIPKKNKPKVAVVLIGTNDLTNSGWSATIQSVKEKALAKEIPGIVSRITTAVKEMRKRMPNTTIVLLGILPRGTGTGKGLLNADNDFSWPSHYTKAIATINSRLKRYASKSRSKVVYLDCGRLFLTRNKRAINAALMADAIHPTKKGWDKLARCFLPAVQKRMEPRLKRRG